jgi:hypothetical protein
MKFNIGIDFGGVLSVHYKESNIIAKNGDHINTTMDMPYAIESLKKLKNVGNDLFLISFCGKARSVETRKSIIDNNVGELFTELYFVKKREHKNILCKYIGCHFMIDDREDVLDFVVANNDSIITILFGNKGKNDRHKYAKDWKEVVCIIQNTKNHFESIVEKVDIEKIIH